MCEVYDCPQSYPNVNSSLRTNIQTPACVSTHTAHLPRPHSSPHLINTFHGNAELSLLTSNSPRTRAPIHTTLLTGPNTLPRLTATGSRQAHASNSKPACMHACMHASGGVPLPLTDRFAGNAELEGLDDLDGPLGDLGSDTQRLEKSGLRRLHACPPQATRAIPHKSIHGFRRSYARCIYLSAARPRETEGVEREERGASMRAGPVTGRWITHELILMHTCNVSCPECT